jgi:hypothetical protein
VSEKNGVTARDTAEAALNNIEKALDTVRVVLANLREAWAQCGDEYTAEMGWLGAEWDAALAALRRYGKHDMTCRSLDLFTAEVKYPVLCDCGLRAALSREEGETQ